MTMLVTAAGCSKQDETDLMNTAEKAMEEKYGESFTAIKIKRLDRKAFRAWLSPSSIPSAVTRITVNNDGTGLLDDYFVVKLCHGLTEKTEQILRAYPGDCYVHTDNSQEYAWSEDPDITAAEYLNENKGDMFFVSVILNKENADLPALSRELLKLPPALGINRGFLDVYILDEEEYAGIQKQIGKYDNMSSSEVKYTLDDAGGPVISMNFSKTYTSAEEILRSIEN